MNLLNFKSQIEDLVSNFRLPVFEKSVSDVSCGSNSFKQRKTVAEEWLLREVLSFVVVSSYCEMYLMVSCISVNLDVLAASNYFNLYVGLFF